MMLCSGYFQSLFLSHESLELFIAPQHKYKVPQMHFAYTYLDIFEVKKSISSTTPRCNIQSLSHAPLQ